MRSDQRLEVRLLGALALRLDGAEVGPLGSARAESLLAYLLLHRDAPQSRQHLAFLLWPDSTESQARTNLRHVLHLLRRGLPDADRFLHVTPGTIEWRSDAPFWLDVAALEDAVARADQEKDGQALPALRDAVEAYGGDLLESSYDEWLLYERERLRLLYLEAVRRLVHVLDAQGAYSEGIAHAERLLRHDPLDEEPYRIMMKLHHARGERAKALRVYHVCAATLERELGVEPSKPTRDAYGSLLRGEDEEAPPSPGRAPGEAPLVGRAAEWSRLTDLAAMKGPSFVLVAGEAGIGKTRLVEEFRSWWEHRAGASAESRSYAAEGALAFGPVVTWLRSEALVRHLGSLDRATLGELARLLPELRSAEGLPEPEPLSEADERHRLFEALARAILSTGEPLLLLTDDLHWADPETLRFLHYLMRAEPETPLLLVATARQEELDQRLLDLLTGLRALDRMLEIELRRLSLEETTALAERVRGRSLDPEEADRLFAETEGTPLFVVEALRAGWVGGAGEPPDTPRVRAVIESRFAQLSEAARGVASTAATIGREFTAEVLAEASGTGEEDLVRGLDELWRRRVIRERGPDAYDFAHEKLREAAYAALSPALRRATHLAVAQALESLHADDPTAVSGELAMHYDRAGAADEAIPWYGWAAGLAQRVHAAHEAVRLLERALALLDTLPETRERRMRRLALLAALPAPLGVVEGYGSDRIAEVQRQGIELARALGVEPGPALLHSAAVSSLTRGEFDGARRIGEALREGGVREGDAVRLVEAEYVLGIAAFWRGDFEAARDHFQLAVEAYRPEHRAAHLVHYGQDAKVVCLSRLGNTLWFLGRIADAVRARDDALALADHVGHPHSRHTALAFASMLDLELGDDDAARDRLGALQEPGGERARQTVVVTAALAGYVDVVDGRRDEGVAAIRRALEESGGTDHAPGMRAAVARLLVAASMRADDPVASLEAADQALSLDDEVATWTAEVRRVRSECLERLGAPVSAVETEIEMALDLARRQGARMLELRAAVSLVRHRVDRGDVAGAARARELLRRVIEVLPEAAESRERRESDALLAKI